MTRFGDPVRVLTEPGLAWKLPAPIEGTIPVDLRLRTTSSGLQDVGTRDGLRILVQAYRRLAGAGRSRRASGSSCAPCATIRTRRRASCAASSAPRCRSPRAISISPIWSTPIPPRCGWPRSRSSCARSVAQPGARHLRHRGAAGRRRAAEPARRRRWPPRSRACAPSARRSRRSAPPRACARPRRSAPTPTRDARITVAEGAHRGGRDRGRVAARRRRRSTPRPMTRDPQLYMMLRSLDTLGAVVGAQHAR